jgi:hypothetical protein
MTTPTSPRAHAAAGSVVQVGGRIAALLSSVVLMGYLTRRLGTAEYGRYAVSFVLMNWLAISIAVATGGATVRLVAGKENGRRYAVSMLQMVGVVATTLAVLIALAAQPLADLLRSPGIAPLLRIFSADFATQPAITLKQTPIPILPLAPASQRLGRIDEKPRFLWSSHLDFGVKREVKVQTRRPCFRRTNDDKVGESPSKIRHGQAGNHKCRPLANHAAFKGGPT